MVRRCCHGRLSVPFGLALAVIFLEAITDRAVAQQPSASSQSSASPERRATRLKESADLKAQAERQKAVHKLDEAAVTLGRALVIDRELFGETSPQFADALMLVAGIDERREDWAAAIKACEAVLAIRLKQFGKEHWRTTDVRRAVEFTAALRQLDASQRKRLWDADDKADAIARLQQQKKLKEALSLAEQLVEARKTVLGGKHWQVAEALHGLGRQHLMAGDWVKGRRINEEALNLRREVLGEQHPDTGRSWFNLGQALGNLKESQRALEAFRKAASIWQLALGEEDPLTVMAVDRLAYSLWQQKDLVGARESYTKLLAIRRKVLAKDSPDIARTLTNLGFAQWNLGDYASARKSYEEALLIRRKLLPADSPDIAQCLYNLGLVQAELLDYGAARKSHEEALAIRRKVLPKGDPDIAWSLNNVGLAQWNLRDYATARKSHEEALAIFRAVLPHDNPDVATSLNNLGIAQWNLHDYASSRMSHEEALAIRRKVLPKDDPDIAFSLSNLGAVQDDLHDYVSARKSHEEALAIRRKVLPKNDPEIARSLNNLGLVQWHLHDYPSSRKRHEEALAIRRKVLPKDDLDIAWSLNNLGAAQDELHDYASARKSHEEALAIRRKVLPKDHSDITMSLSNLGLSQWHLHDYASARKSHEEALAIRRKVLPKNDLDIATSLNNLGNVQDDLRDCASALKSHEEALAIRRKVLPKDDPDIAWSLNNLGVVQYSLRDYRSARKSQEEALAIRRKVLPKDSPDIALSLINLGILETVLGDFWSAQKSHEEALAIRRKVLPKDDPDIAMNLHNLGIVQVALFDYASARKSLEESLAIRRKVHLDDNQDVALALEGLASLDLVAGAAVRGDVARLEEAIDLYQRDQLRLALSQAEQEQLVTAVSLHRSLSLLLSATLALKADPGRVYDRVVRVKGAVTAQQRWARQARDSADPQTKRLLDRLRQVNTQLLKLSFADRPASGTHASQDASALIQDLSSERAELERQLSEHSPVYRTFQANGQIGGDQIRAALPDETALIDIVEYNHVGPRARGWLVPFAERRLLAFVVRPSRENVAVVPLGPSQPLAELIDRWRASYGVGKLPRAGDPDPAAKLREGLWQPLAKHLAGVKVVLVSPDGPLHGLPWAALPGAKPGSFLIQDHAFAVVPVPQLLPELLRTSPRPAKEPPSLLLAGGIAFGEGAHAADGRDGKLPPVPVFGPLVGTESEVNDLRAQFEDAFPNAPAPKILHKDKATKAAFLAAAPSYRFLHLATHGFFANESEKSVLSSENRAAMLQSGMQLRADATGRNPGLLSGVVFAGVNQLNRPREETILTALEAAELDRGKTELLVLSACETGRGQVAGGEGVLGLQRAFQLAGARTVVASLWRVPDEETHQLMREFYRRVWSDKPVSKAEALRQAQIWMLEHWKPRGLDTTAEPKGPPPPHVWAAFVLSGDWR